MLDSACFFAWFDSGAMGYERMFNRREASLGFRQSELIFCDESIFVGRNNKCVEKIRPMRAHQPYLSSILLNQRHR